MFDIFAFVFVALSGAFTSAMLTIWFLTGSLLRMFSIICLFAGYVNLKDAGIDFLVPLFLGASIGGILTFRTWLKIDIDD